MHEIGTLALAATLTRSFNGIGDGEGESVVIKRIEQPEYRDALEARKGFPEGPHIKPEPDGEEVYATLMDDRSRDEDREERIIARMARMRLDEERRAQPKRWFDGTINLSFLWSVVLGLGGVIVIGITTISTYQRDQAAIYNSLAQVSNTVGKVDSNVTNLGTVVKANEDAAELRVAKYAPQIEALNQSQKVQDERFQNMAAGIISLRDSVQKLADIVGVDHTDMQVLKVEQGKAPAPTPHEH